MKTKEEIKQPTLNDLIKKMKKEGGYLKGKGDGRVHWKPEDSENQSPKTLSATIQGKSSGELASEIASGGDSQSLHRVERRLKNGE